MWMLSRDDDGMNQTLRNFSLALPVFSGEEGGLPAVDETRHSLSPLWLNALRSLVLAARFEQLVFAFIQFVATPLIQCSHGYTLRADFKDVCDVRHTYGYGVRAVGTDQGVQQRIVEVL